jgi:carbonic anhydrase
LKLKVMNADDVIARLKEGNKRFVEDRSEPAPVDTERRAELVSGQQPWAIVLTCSDSRVVPEAIFNTGLGELFVVRVAGNVANTSSIASIEYAVAHLKTPVIVVLGHQDCGAVKAALKGGDNGDNLNHLLEHIGPAIRQSQGDNTADKVARTNTRLTAKALAGTSAIIAEAVQREEVEIIPAFYHLNSGEVEFME